jgi:hypothetical protein
MKPKKINISVANELTEDIVDLGTETLLPPPANAKPPPATGGTQWWTCPNENCRVYGYAATATVVDYDRVFRKSCRRCKGAGRTLNEDPCEGCDGHGWHRTTIHVHQDPTCPSCGADVVLLSTGSFPQGYPRLDMGGNEGDDTARGGRGNVSWRWHPPTDG